MPPTTSLETLKTRIATQICAARKARRWSEEEFAHAANVNRSYASALETCTANPSLALLHRIAVALEIDVADLLTPDPSQTR